MKIRILENSLRLRLTQSEVKQLFENGSVGQTAKFGSLPSQQLHYAVQKTDTTDIKAVYNANGILVEVPNEKVDVWAKSNEVSLQEFMPINETESLKILIEKDFKCLTDREGEDESDMFPNPDETTLKC